MSKKSKTFIKRVIFFLVLGVVVILILGSLSKPKTAAKYTSYTIEQGDTLWSIASKHKSPHMRYDEYIYLIQKHNNINANIQAGQTIEILTEETERR